MCRFVPFIIAVLCFFPNFIFADSVQIDIAWDTFNSNIYRGVIALPAEEGKEREYIDGDNDTSQDGHVTGGGDSNSVFSSNSVSWTINNPKKGLYKVYLFPGVNDRPNKAVWSDDVAVRIKTGGNTHTIRPRKERGNVWYVCALEGRTGKIFERQTFYPVRRMIAGTVIDGLTGDAVPGAKVQLFNKDTGDLMPDYTTESDKSGFYVVYGFPMGRYELRFSKKAYVDTSKAANFTLRDLPVDFSPMLSPVISDAEYRVVLSWGKEPADLDAHITGPGEGGSGSFHISYQNMHVYNERHTLDIDDTDSYGPETVTVKGVDPGTYEYFVHDFSNRRKEDESWGLSLSGAEVTVFRGDSQVERFSVPESEGTLWRVFTIDGRTGKIEPRNTMEYVEEP